MVAGWDGRPTRPASDALELALMDAVANAQRHPTLRSPVAELILVVCVR